MTIRINLNEGADLDNARQLFESEDTVRQVIRGVADRDFRPVIGFRRLHAYATGSGDIEDSELTRALAEDENLRADLHALLAKTALNHLPEVAAASSGELSSRESAGCRIRIEPSRAEPDQAYVIIELVDREAPFPTMLFTFNAEGRSDTLALPEGRDGVVQVLLDADAPVLESLKDHAAEVFLR